MVVGLAEPVWQCVRTLGGWRKSQDLEFRGAEANLLLLIFNRYSHMFLMLFDIGDVRGFNIRGGDQCSS